MSVHDPLTLSFEIWGPIRRDQLPGLFARVCKLFGQSRAAVAFCEVHAVAADAVTVDALARLQLAARRQGCQVRLRGVSDELRALLEFMGLDDVLPE